MPDICQLAVAADSALNIMIKTISFFNPSKSSFASSGPYHPAFPSLHPIFPAVPSVRMAFYQMIYPVSFFTVFIVNHWVVEISICPDAFHVVGA